VQAPLGCGGNAEVYKVKVISHSPAAGAAAGQQEADASANDSAANAAAADAPVLGAPCSYMPGQQFALKIPRAYQSLPPAEQQRWDATGYFLNSHMVLQQEQKLLSCVAHSDCVLHCHAYGVVKYGLFGLQELPCLLLELGDGSVLQRLEEYQAAAAAAATGPACRPVGLPDGEVWQIIRHVLTGLTDLSKAHIAWKDLKLSNILYVTRGERESIVLCDFGSGVLVGEDGLESAPAPAGTEGFVSPELKYGRRVGTACDVWGVGCLLLALRLGRGVQLLPDVEPDGAAASWDAAAVLHEVESELLPVELAFVARCLSYDPAGRPSPWDLQWCEYADNVPASLGGNVGGEELNAFISQIVTAGMAAAD
jgi:serine/threonine protein kinase